MKSINNNYYYSLVPQSYEERINMYMSHSKEELAQMLAERDKYIIPEACKEMIN